MSVLVTALRLRNRFLPGYAGRLAQSYETHREGVRWRGEQKAFKRLYAQANPASVIDSPVGTGRWLPHYRRHRASVLGLDLSDHMLAEARKKVTPGADVRLEKGDILDPEFVRSIKGEHDLIVCTRFAHWLSHRELGTLVDNFIATGARFVLIGAKTNPSIKRRQDWRDLLRWSELRRRGRSLLHRNVINHVHDEAQLAALFTRRNWSLVDKVQILRGRGSDYHFFLFAAPSAE